MNKKLKVEDILKKIEFLQKLGPSLYLLFMHGYIDETEQERTEQLEMINKIGERSQNPVCIPFPGTPYFEKVAEKIPELRNVDPAEYDGGNPNNKILKLIEDYKWNQLQ